MKPPNGDPRTYLGTDDANSLWLLAWALPGAPGMWSALGLDHRRYPCVRTLVGDYEGMIVRLFDVQEAAPQKGPVEGCLT